MNKVIGQTYQYQVFKDYKDLTRIKDIVEEILKGDEKARNSDAYLFTQVVLYLYPRGYSLPFYLTMTDPNCPSYESVRRSRQKVQEEHPEYKANKVVEEKRQDNIEEYLKLALGK